MFLDFEKTIKTLENVRIVSQPLIHNYRKSVSHQHQTSGSEMRTQETMQLRTVCDKRL